MGHGLVESLVWSWSLHFLFYLLKSKMSINYTHFKTYKGQRLNKDYFLDEKDNLYYIEDDWLVAVPVNHDGTVAIELYYKVPRKPICKGHTKEEKEWNVTPIYERVNHFDLVKDVRSKHKRY